ncbi:hypothetical protein [Brasilonema sp. UFV-L1]|uniref:hypothetical protein n=1 Tax=Brasilonema sp. UFV-L1 TaxID=2234130 RepID=UPI00145EEFC0|nr:hypothetical protein [Brasilonema sp. UFV-L1]NMG05992.1 hypothetical protein [Brasilonema sp. UFV-L1]
MPEENTTISEFQTQVDSQAPLLPRSAWSHQVAYLRVVFRAKKALDRIEKEAGVVNVLKS